MKRTRVGSGGWMALGGAAALGCATVVTRQAELAKVPDGIRVYPPKVCLLVDTAANATVIATFPDPARAYDVKPRTILAKQDFKLELEAGQVIALTANQDTSVLPRFLTDVAEVAAGAVGAAVSAPGTLKGTFGFDDGVHCMRDDGSFEP